MVSVFDPVRTAADAPPWSESPDAGYCAPLGGAGAVLLAGPTHTDGAEPLDEHLARVGPLPDLTGDQVLSEVRAAGLVGRGGGGFPLWRKLEAALESGHTRVLIVNCSESEPASRKDRTLCSFRPHAVLDGAALIARVLGADEVVVHLHDSDASMLEALWTAVAERTTLEDPRWNVSLGPGWLRGRRGQRRRPVRPRGYGAPRVLVDTAGPGWSVRPADRRVQRRDGSPCIGHRPAGRGAPGAPRDREAVRVRCCSP